MLDGHVGQVKVIKRGELRPFMKKVEDRKGNFSGIHKETYEV